jgi:hypothetical protein
LGIKTSSAKLKKRFLLLFLEKEGYFYSEEQLLGFGSASPSFGYIERSSAKQNYAFASGYFYTEEQFLGGKPPNPLGRLRRVLDIVRSSAKQNKRFLLLFLEKEGYFYSEEQLLGFGSASPRFGYIERSSAKQNYAFASGYFYTEEPFLGGLGRLRRVNFGNKWFWRSRTTLFNLLQN